MLLPFWPISCTSVPLLVISFWRNGNNRTVNHCCVSEVFEAFHMNLFLMKTSKSNWDLLSSFKTVCSMRSFQVSCKPNANDLNTVCLISATHQPLLLVNVIQSDTLAVNKATTFWYSIGASVHPYISLYWLILNENLWWHCLNVWWYF